VCGVLTLTAHDLNFKQVTATCDFSLLHTWLPTHFIYIKEICWAMSLVLLFSITIEMFKNVHVYPVA
jgi:hypothetical protein